MCYLLTVRSSQFCPNWLFFRKKSPQDEGRQMFYCASYFKELLSLVLVGAISEIFKDG